MDAVKFLKEAKRMCHEDKCHECALEYGPLCDLRSYFNGAPVGMTVEEMVKAVEQWSTEHPLVTNGMKVEELIPANNRTTRFLDGTNGSLVQILVDRKWWDAEYKGEVK